MTILVCVLIILIAFIVVPLCLWAALVFVGFCLTKWDEFLEKREAA